MAAEHSNIRRFIDMDYVAQHTSMPREINAEKERMPMAYLGLGILEWHGEHALKRFKPVKLSLQVSFTTSDSFITG
jgi:hypothetical protein